MILIGGYRARSVVRRDRLDFAVCGDRVALRRHDGHFIVAGRGLFRTVLFLRCRGGLQSRRHARGISVGLERQNFRLGRWNFRLQRRTDRFRCAAATADRRLSPAAIPWAFPKRDPQPPVSRSLAACAWPNSECRPTFYSARSRISPRCRRIGKRNRIEFFRLEQCRTRQGRIGMRRFFLIRAERRVNQGNCESG